MSESVNCVIHSFIQCIRTIKSHCFLFSAPADPSAEDESTHTTGNGVVSEVGNVHTHVHCLTMNVVNDFFVRIVNRISLFPLCV